MKRLALFGTGLLLVSAWLPAEAQGQWARATLRNAQGDTVGMAALTQASDGVHITLRAAKLPPGYHGFHVHAVGRCEGPAFTSAGGHFNPAAQKHPQHAGDLPALLVDADGTAWMTFKSTRFKLDDLFDADGSALIVHADPDNYANIPGRYRPERDGSTFATGDAGGRLACGVIVRVSP